MKIREGFILREVAGTYAVVATGEAAQQFNGIIKLNPVGAFMWKALSAGTTRSQLLDDLTDVYEVDRATAEKDIDAFIAKVIDAGFMSDDR